MAGRTSSGVGVGVAITILGVSTLTFFVLSFVFLGQRQTAEKNLREYQESVKEFVRDSERNTDEVRRIAQEAKGEGQSVLGYTVSKSKELGQKVTGSSADGMAAMVRKIEGVAGSDRSSLVQLLSDKDSTIDSLDKKLRDTEASRAAALTDLESQVRLVNDLKASHEATVKQLSADLDRYKGEVDQYRAEVEASKAFMEGRVQSTVQESQAKEVELTQRIGKLQEELLVAQNQLQVLRAKSAGQTLGATNEAALVDGMVVGSDAASDSVFINRGSDQRVVLGMTFEVYSEAGQVRPDEDGVYPSGKASLEVTNVDRSASTCRIVRTTRGQPVVKGDVIANAIYDPTKVYRFMVYGNFDANRDGLSTPEEAEDVKALVREWGGEVAESLSGDADFLVLGSRPVLPPPPPPGAPVEIVAEFQRKSQAVLRYDALFDQATRTSIPILNENRLDTLTGRR